MSSSGGNGAPAGGGSADGGDAQRRTHRVQIIVAVIAALAALCVPLVAYLLNRGDHVDPTRAEGSTNTSQAVANPDPCNLDELSQPWIKPESEPQQRQYYKSGTAPKVRVQLSTGDNPSIEVRGQIELKSHLGEDLILAAWPDNTSHDQKGNKGSGQYYPHGFIEPDTSGCWNDQPHPVGYPGAKGITEVYYLVLVPHAEATRLLADAKNRDGYSPKEWAAFDTTTVFSFTIPTA